MFSDVALTGSLDDAISALTPLLRVPALAPQAATRLLERLRCGLEDEAGTRKLVRALRRLLPPPPPPCVAEQLLELLAASDYPAPIVEELAGLVSLSNDHAALALVVERYAALQAADRALLLPVLGSLFDLPLTGALAAQAASLAIDALNVVDEEDVPAVARTLLKAAASVGHLDSGSITATSGNGSNNSSSSNLGLLRRAVAAVRAQGALLSSAPLAVLLMDVLAQHLPLSSGASRAFLQEAVGASVRVTGMSVPYATTRSSIGVRGADQDVILEGDEEEDQEKQGDVEEAMRTSQMGGPTVFDAAVLVLLLQQPQHAPPLGAALEHLVRTGAVPFNALHALSQLASEGHSSNGSSGGGLSGLSSVEHTASPFASLVPPLLHLGLWLMLAPLRLAHAHADVTQAHADRVTAAATAAVAPRASSTTTLAAGSASKRTGSGSSSSSKGNDINASGYDSNKSSHSNRSNSGALSDSEANWLVEQSCALLEICFASHPSARETIARAALVLATTAGAGTRTNSGGGGLCNSWVSNSACHGCRASKNSNSSAFVSCTFDSKDWMSSTSSRKQDTTSQAAAAAAAAAASSNAAAAFAAAAAAREVAQHEEARVGIAAAKLLARLCRQAPEALLPLAPRLLDAALYAPDFDTGDELGSSTQATQSWTEDKFPLPVERTKPLFAALAALAAYHPPTTQALLIFVQKKLLTPLPTPSHGLLSSSSSLNGVAGKRGYSKQSKAEAEADTAVLSAVRSRSTPLSGRAAAVLLASALIKPIPSLLSPLSSSFDDNHSQSFDDRSTSDNSSAGNSRHSVSRESRGNLSAPDEEALATWVARACFESGGHAAATATSITPQLACSGLAFFRTRFHSNSCNVEGDSSSSSSSGGGRSSIGQMNNSRSPHRALAESLARTCLAKSHFVRSQLALPPGHQSVGNSGTSGYSMIGAAARMGEGAQFEVVVDWDSTMSLNRTTGGFDGSFNNDGSSASSSNHPPMLGVASLVRFFILGQDRNFAGSSPTPGWRHRHHSNSLRNGNFGSDSGHDLDVAVAAVKHGTANVITPGAAADVINLIEECFQWELEACRRGAEGIVRASRREQSVTEVAPPAAAPAEESSRAQTFILAWQAWGAAPWVMPAWPLPIDGSEVSKLTPAGAAAIPAAGAPPGAAVNTPWEKGFLGAGARANAVAIIAAAPLQQRATIGWATAIGCRLATTLAEGALLNQRRESCTSQEDSSSSSSSWKPTTWVERRDDVTALLPAADRLLLLRDAAHVAILAVARAAAAATATSMGTAVGKEADDSVWDSDMDDDNAPDVGRATGEENGTGESANALPVERSSERWGGGGSDSDSDSNGEGGVSRHRRRPTSADSTAAAAAAAAAKEDEEDAAEDAAWANHLFGSLGSGNSSRSSVSSSSLNDSSSRNSDGASNGFHNSHLQCRSDIGLLGRSHGALLDALHLGLHARNSANSSISGGGSHRHRGAAHGLTTALHLPLLARALAARLHLHPPLTAPSNANTTSRNGLGIGTSNSSSSYQSSNCGDGSQHGEQKRNWWCFDAYEVHVRTHCLATFLDLFLRAEDNRSDDGGDNDDNGSDSDTDAGSHKKKTSSSPASHSARFHLPPPQRWLAATELLAGPLLRYCEDLDWALPVLRASAAARSAALTSARAAQEAENTTTSVSNVASKGSPRSTGTTGGSGSSSSSSNSSNSNSGGDCYVSYAAASHLQSLQYAALQLLFRRCHWWSHDAWARQYLPSPSAAAGSSASALRSLPRGLALIVEKYYATTSVPQAGISGGASSSSSSGSSGLENLWATLKAQCLRSEDLSHAHALIDLLASLSLHLRIASTVGALSTRLLAQPYAVTDARSRLVPDGLFLSRRGGGGSGHASAEMSDVIGGGAALTSANRRFATDPTTSVTFAPGSSAVTAASSPRAGDSSLWSSASAAWERGALPSLTSASLELSGGGLCVPLTLETLTKPGLYLPSNSGYSHGQIPPLPAAAAAALAALARLCGLPPDKSKPASATNVSSFRTLSSRANSWSSHNNSSSSSSHSDRSASLVSLLAFEWAATPLAPSLRSTSDRNGQDENDNSSTLTRAGAAARLVERLRYLALRLETGSSQDKASASKSPRSNNNSNSSSSSASKRHAEASALAAAVRFEWLTDDLQPTLVAATFAVVLATLATAEPSLACVTVEEAPAKARPYSEAAASPLLPSPPLSPSSSLSQPLSFGPYQPLGDACAAAGWLLASCREALTVPSPEQGTAGATADVAEAGGARGSSSSSSYSKAGRSRKQCKLSPTSSPRSPSAAASLASPTSLLRGQQQKPVITPMLPTVARALEACAIKFLRGLGPCLEERLAQLVHWRATHLDTQTTSNSHGTYGNGSSGSGGSGSSGGGEAGRAHGETYRSALSSTLEQAARVEHVQRVCDSAASLLTTARELAHFLAEQAKAKMAMLDLGNGNSRHRGRRVDHRSRRQTMPLATRSLPRLLLVLARADAAPARMVELFRLDHLSNLVQSLPASFRSSSSSGGQDDGGSAAASGSKRLRSRDQKRETKSTHLRGKRSRRVGGSNGHNRSLSDLGGLGSRSGSENDSDDDDKSSGSESSGSDSAYEDNHNDAYKKEKRATKGGTSAATAGSSAREWRRLVPNFLAARQGSMGNAEASTTAAAAATSAANSSEFTLAQVDRRNFPSTNNSNGGDISNAGKISANGPAGSSAEGGADLSARSGAMAEQPAAPFGFAWSVSEDNGSESDGSGGSDSEFMVLGSGGAWG